MHIKTLLAKINYARELFVLEFERGREAYIPKELALEDFPINFWYYDPLFFIIQDLISVENKEFMMFQNQFRLEYCLNRDQQDNVFNKLFGQKPSLVFK